MNRKTVKKMAEQRLIDANIMAEDESEAYISAQTSGKISPITQGLNSVVHRKIQQLIADTPTINPESLPVVRKLRKELARVTAERDAVIKELNGVSSLVDDLAEFVDREIHPVVDYNLYLDLRKNVDAVSMFQHEDEWRGLHKEE